jgi:hypothetical protein
MRLLPFPSLGLYLLTLCLLAGDAALAGIQISLSKPGGSLTPADFELTAHIQSTFQLSSVQAQLGGRSFPMPASPESRAVISIAGLPFGEHTLTVTARDIQGAEGQATLVLAVDRPARLSLSLPVPGAVARPAVRITASCEDDGPEGCEVSVTGRVPPPRDNPRAPSVELLSLSAPGQLDQEVCLAEHVGEQVIFTLRARGGAGPESEPVDVAVFVEDSQRLSPIVSVPGELLDFDEQRLLFVDAQRRARVMERATGRVETLLEPLQPNHELCGLSCSRFYDVGYLAPRGALFLSGGELVRVQDGGSELLGTLLKLPATRPAPLMVAGPFVAYEPYTSAGEPPGWRLRDLTTGTTDLIPPPASLTEDGAVLSTDASGLVRYKDGQSVLLAGRGEGIISSPISEGEDVVFQRSLGDTRETVLLRAGQQHVLADTSFLPEHQVINMLAQGWVAFVRPGGGVGQVWLRSPTGVEAQLSSWGTHSTPRLLGPAGTIIYESGGTSYLSGPGSASVPFSSSKFLRLFKLENGTPHVALGNTVFRVKPTAPAEPLTCPRATPRPERGRGCAAAGSGSVWLVTLTLLALGSRRLRRARAARAHPRARSET